MQLTQRHVDICWAFYERYNGLAHGSDDERRILTRMIAEQICFEFGSGWGTKSSVEGNPPSKDSFTYREQTNSFVRLWNWDWQNGETRKPQIFAGQEGEDITDQFFIRVNPFNHLGIVTPPNPNPNPIPDPDPNPIPDNEVIKLLKDMDLRLKRIEQDVDTIYEKINEGIELKPSNFPNYEGRLSGWAGGNIKLSPKND